MSYITNFSVPPTKITRLWTSTTTHPTTCSTTTGGMFESFAYFNFFFTPVDRYRNRISLFVLRLKSCSNWTKITAWN